MRRKLSFAVPFFIVLLGVVVLDPAQVHAETSSSDITCVQPSVLTVPPEGTLPAMSPRAIVISFVSDDFDGMDWQAAIAQGAVAMTVRDVEGVESAGELRLEYAPQRLVWEPVGPLRTGEIYDITLWVDWPNLPSYCATDGLQAETVEWTAEVIEDPPTLPGVQGAVLVTADYDWTAHQKCCEASSTCWTVSYVHTASVEVTARVPPDSPGWVYFTSRAVLDGEPRGSRSEPVMAGPGERLVMRHSVRSSQREGEICVVVETVDSLDEATRTEVLSTCVDWDEIGVAPPPATPDQPLECDGDTMLVTDPSDSDAADNEDTASSSIGTDCACAVSSGQDDSPPLPWLGGLAALLAGLAWRRRRRQTSQNPN